MLAFGVFRLRTHSIQFRMLADVCGSPLAVPLVASVSILSAPSDIVGSRFGCMCISSAKCFVKPPVGVTVCLSISIMPAFE